jgi:hypothetical protein
VAVGAVTYRAHDCNDLLDGRRVSGVLLALVPGRAATVIAGDGCRDRRWPATSNRTDLMNPPFSGIG